MVLKYVFDRVVALCGLLVLWPVVLFVAIMVKVKMPGGPAFFFQKRVGMNGRIFDICKFRTMVSDNANDNADLNVDEREGWSTVSIAGESRITPLGAFLRKYKIDSIPELWNVLKGDMSLVGPRPDVPGYADMLQGKDAVVLKMRPGITGPASLKYRHEEECLANARNLVYRLQFTAYGISKEELDKMSEQEVAVWYNDNVIYPDKVRLNCYYYHHYSFIKDIQMIFCTVLGMNMKYAGETI